MYSNIYCPEIQSGDQPLQSGSFFFFFFQRESKERLAQKLKKIAYVSLSGEMKKKGIWIYIVRKVNVVIKPFRAVFFFWEQRKARKLNKIV